MSCTSMFMYKMVGPIGKNVRGIEGSQALYKNHRNWQDLFMSCTAMFKYKSVGAIVRDVREF